MGTNKGIYNPRYPEKYIGDATKIYFRSSWELRVFQFMDLNRFIHRWGSEEIQIPYIKPTDGRTHRYFPDIYCEYYNKSGVLIKELIEIKPKKEVALTKKSSDYDKINIIINHAKWNAAEEFCKSHGIRFRILTENELFGKKK